MSKRSKRINKRIKSLKKLAEVLVGLLYELEAKYELVKPMIFDKDLPSVYNDQSYAAKGFEFLRISLYLDCIKDSSRLYHDPYDTSPSVINILDYLSDSRVNDKLREEFSSWKMRLSQSSGVLFETEAEEVKVLEDKFNALYKQIKVQHQQLVKSKLLKRIQKARNKVIAHADVTKVNGEYEKSSAENFGLKWGDVEEFIKSTRGLVFDIALLINNTSYDDGSFKRAHQKASTSFWEVTTKGSF